MQHSGLAWPDQIAIDFQEKATLSKENYVSKAGSEIITSFSLSEAWAVIVATLILVWISGWLWKERLDV